LIAGQVKHNKDKEAGSIDKEEKDERRQGHYPFLFLSRREKEKESPCLDLFFMVVPGPVFISLSGRETP